MLCQLALLLLLSSLQPGSLHEIDSESTAMSLYCGDWGKESGLLIEGVSSIQGHNFYRKSLLVVLPCFDVCRSKSSHVCHNS